MCIRDSDRTRVKIDRRVIEQMIRSYGLLFTEVVVRNISAKFKDCKIVNSAVMVHFMSRLCEAWLPQALGLKMAVQVTLVVYRI